MKTIKYRIHIPEAPQLFGDPMYYQGNQYLSSFLRRVYSQYGCNHPSYLPFQIEERLELFTGFQDKNGEDIYIGDIVRFSEYYSGDYLNKESIEAIKWEENGFTDKLMIGYYDCPSWCEVVGNIRENPELLTSKE